LRKDTSLKNQPVGVLARCGGHPIQHMFIDYSFKIQVLVIVINPFTQYPNDCYRILSWRQ
jgi:hypothetical protein